MRTLDWYFDFVSPFSYLQAERFKDLPDDVEIAFHPVLLAGLLKHWESKGPAEIPAKRRFTYRHVQWYAQRRGIPFRMPPAHPFNPLPALRLAIALGSRREPILEMFRFIWGDGRLIEDPVEWQILARKLGVADPEARVSAPEVKAGLRENTERAAAMGVFGVPSFVIDGNVFWGVDATDMLIDYLREPTLFDSPEMQRVSELPVATERRR
ncbi:MAG: 2-hydroxychromene-2-carboxylate isomerase [Gammaproteobacteria bacterium]|nr:2-hydroxychromene-2-carboxylate isomerase [Gammaproteobacteria bacterium]